MMLTNIKKLNIKLSTNFYRNNIFLQLFGKYSYGVYIFHGMPVNLKEKMHLLYWKTIFLEFLNQHILI